MMAMNTNHETTMIDPHDAGLTDQAAALVEAARRAGADAADAVVVRSASLAVSVRDGKVENTNAAESDDFSLRVFVGKKVASVGATPSSNPVSLAERAVAMAKVSPEDPYQGLANETLLARDLPDLDLADHTTPDAGELTEAAKVMDAAALAVEGVTRSGAASASAGRGGMVLVTSHGFHGAYSATHYTRSVSAVAGEGTQMERDYDFCHRLHHADLEASSAIGQRAGERAVRRLGARKAQTGSVPVVFDPRVARSIAGHLSGALNGAAIARKSGFLKDAMGETVAASNIQFIDDPLVPRGAGSRPFDGEGVAGQRLAMVEDGVLKHWFLASPQARQLGLSTNGRASRSGSSMSPSSTNTWLAAGDSTPDDLIAAIDSGFYVTEVFGHGVNMVTGEYSRGASGFWIDKGEITYPVSEITIASNLKDMFMRMVPANDLDLNYSTAAPTLMIEGMTVAGK